MPRRGSPVERPAVTLTVDAASPGAAWNRFYEGAVATDHANTILTGAWGRNAQDALKKGHDEAGFRYARFHGILNRDIGVYPDVAPALATETPDYHWTRFDQVYDAVVAAGMRPIVEISFTPPALASNATQLQAQLWYNGVSPNISKPAIAAQRGGAADLGSLAEVHGGHRPPPRGALRRRGGAQQLVLRGLERGDLDVRGPARPATTSSTATPRSA